jgi:hypothetical protein
MPENLILTPEGGCLHDTGAFRGKLVKFTQERKENRGKVMIKMKAVKDSEYE